MFFFSHLAPSAIKNNNNRTDSTLVGNRSSTFLLFKVKLSIFSLLYISKVGLVSEGNVVISLAAHWELCPRAVCVDVCS